MLLVDAPATGQHQETTCAAAADVADAARVPPAHLAARDPLDSHVDVEFLLRDDAPEAPDAAVADATNDGAPAPPCEADAEAEPAAVQPDAGAHGVDGVTHAGVPKPARVGWGGPNVV